VTPPPKAEPPKTPPPKTTPPPKSEPPKVAKTPPPPTKTEPPKSNADVEASYKQGLMKFARGDTSGALASLRTALAGNPNYAPTWRGLGLVFEKLGEKDQARAAFKRYLQLAPGASDGEQIKGRMERLGS
jgi:Tfp pilus assembly protein PilF